ncbi:MAG: hypothetical protein ORN85_10535, partial [Sediminibacterium sp.]|nr:hypothetical protein [Sediminibacterium sp.]
IVFFNGHSQHTLDYLSRAVVQQEDTFTVTVSGSNHNNINNFFLRKGNYNEFVNLTKISKTPSGSSTNYILKIPTKFTNGKTLEDRVYLLRAGDTNQNNGAGTSNYLLLRVYRTSGTRVLGWGVDSFLLGNSTDTFANLGGVLDFGSNFYQALALNYQGNLITWGTGQYRANYDVTLIKNAVQVTAGAQHLAVLQSDGKVLIWTNPLRKSFITYKLGAADGSPIFFPYPPPTTGNAKCIEIDAGANHVLCLTDSASVIAYGNDSTDQAKSAIDLPDLRSNVVAISGGGGDITTKDNGISIALKKDKTVFAWGRDPDIPSTNVNYGTIRNSNLNQVLGISAGSGHNIIIKDSAADNGKFARGWGVSRSSFEESNLYGNKPKLKNLLKISAGSVDGWGFKYGLALQNSQNDNYHGAVVAWGPGDYVIVDDPENQNTPTDTTPKLQKNIINIEGGYIYPLALRHIFLNFQNNCCGTVTPQGPFIDSAKTVLSNGLYINTWNQNQRIFYKPNKGYKLDYLILGCSGFNSPNYFSKPAISVPYSDNSKPRIIYPPDSANSYTFKNIKNDSCIYIKFKKFYKVYFEVVNGTIDSTCNNGGDGITKCNDSSKGLAFDTIEIDAIEKTPIKDLFFYYKFKPLSNNYRLDSAFYDTFPVSLPPETNYYGKKFSVLDKLSPNDTILSNYRFPLPDSPLFKNPSPKQLIPKDTLGAYRIYKDTLIKVKFTRIYRLYINYRIGRNIIKTDTFIVDSLKNGRIVYDTIIKKPFYRLDTVYIGSVANPFIFNQRNNDSIKAYTFRKVVNDSVINLIYKRQYQFTVKIINGKVNIDSTHPSNRVIYRVRDSASYYVAYLDSGANYKIKHYYLKNGNYYRLDSIYTNNNINSNSTKTLIRFNSNDSIYDVINITKDTSVTIVYKRQYRFLLSLKNCIANINFNAYSVFSNSPPQAISLNILNKDTFFTIDSGYKNLTIKHRSSGINDVYYRLENIFFGQLEKLIPKRYEPYYQDSFYD